MEDKGDNLKIVIQSLKRSSPHQSVNKRLKEDIREIISKRIKVSTEDIIKSIVKEKPPIDADRAEHWVLKLYYNKKSDKELEDEIYELAKSISDEEQRDKAKRYLQKVHNIIENTVINIKEDVVVIEGDLTKLHERTGEELDRLGEKLWRIDVKQTEEDEEGILKKSYKNLERFGGFLTKVVPATALATIINKFLSVIKNNDIRQVVFVGIGIVGYVLLEVIVRAISESRKEKMKDAIKDEIKKVQETTDKKEGILNTRARLIKNNAIDEMKLKIKLLEQKKEFYPTSTPNLPTSN